MSEKPKVYLLCDYGAAVVKLRACMSPEQYERLANRIEDGGLRPARKDGG